MKKIIQVSTLALSILLVGCLELDINNAKNPDNDKVLSDPEALEGLTVSNVTGIFSPYYSENTFYPVNSSLEFTADHTTMTNNVNSWWSVFKQEPRQALPNSLSWPDKNQMLDVWNAWIGVIANSTTIITKLEAEPVLTNQQRGFLACNYFSKAMAYGYIGALFDKGYVIPNNGENYVNEFVPYTDVVNASLTSFDKAIELFEATPDFEMPSSMLGGIGYTADDMIALSKTYYAHFLASSARNNAENLLTDWAKVKQYASEGITKDFIINADGTNIYHTFQTTSGLQWYFRVDHRVMRHFNANLPKRFPNLQEEPNSPYTEDFLKGPGYTGDKRLDAYFKYETDLSFFRASRNNGTLRSHYRIKRYDALYANNGSGPSVFMYAYANQLYLAEAEARLNNLAAAVAILNNPNNPRKKVGEMPDLSNTLTQEQLLEVIYAERDIDLGRTDFGLIFYEMRRRDALQVGTLLHLPVPADEMANLGLAPYTFGGEGNADGINTADGTNSWRN